MPERLDKFLTSQNVCSRKEAGKLVRAGLVQINGVQAQSPAQKLEPGRDRVTAEGQEILYRQYLYIMMHKPAGVLSATEDRQTPTVLDLLPPALSRRGLFPAGRLDKDTTGLLLLTDDGGLAHRLLAPRKHVDKTYRVTIAHILAEGDVRRLEEGLDIGEEKPTLPARVTLLEDTEILLTIQEGKFHQVKRMLQAVGNQVLALKRVSFGGLDLDETLRPGEYRELTEEELERLSGDAGVEMTTATEDRESRRRNGGTAPESRQATEHAERKAWRTGGNGR